MQITPEKTAITNGVSTSCKMLVSDIESNHIDSSNVRVLDYGCGKLRNTKFLLTQNINVSITDTPKQLENMLTEILNLDIDECFDIKNIDYNRKYNYILLSFVLNVVPDISDRETILSNIYNLMDSNSFLYIEVRNDKFLKTLKNKVDFFDGIITGNGKTRTFQKPYSVSEIKEFITQNNFKIIYTKKQSNSIVIKAQKGGE